MTADADNGGPVRCHFCGRNGAVVRLNEIAIARTSRRAHVDCHGHSQYRPVTVAEIDESELFHALAVRP